MIYRTRVLKSLLVVILLIAAVLASRSTRAQEETTPIALGDTVEGTISDTTYQYLYVLTAKAGDSAIISMIAKDELDPYLLLQDSKGQTLAEDDDSAGEHNAQMTYTFEEAGDYTIVATRFGQLSGPSSGEFTLTVKASGEEGTAVAASTSEATTAATAESTSEPTEEATEETTEEVSPTPSRTRNATPTEEITEEATTESTEEATEETTEEVTPTASRTRRPTATRVTPTEEEPSEEPTEEESPTPRATRRVTATRRPTRATPTPTQGVVVTPGEVSLDEPVSGDIDDSKVFYFYDYNATAGEKLSLTVETEGGLQAVLIFSPADTSKKAIKTAAAKNADETVQFDVTVPEDGAYWIIVTRVGGTDGSTSGSFTLTVTAPKAPTVQQINITGTSARIVANLAKAGLVPEGGRQVGTIPGNSFTRASTPGLKYLPILKNLSVQNMVLNFQVTWTTAGQGSGCGMGFRMASTNDYAFVLLTSTGRVSLAQRDGGTTVVDYFEESALFRPGALSTVTVIAIDETITVYINGKLQTSQTGSAVEGGFALQMYNPEGNTTVTNCRFPTGWIWSFD
jgi:hypothetical protein